MPAKPKNTPRKHPLGRVVVVYNPRSSKARRVTAEVIKPLSKRLKTAKNLIKYEVLPTNVDDNAKKLAKILHRHDLVITAGGDGTATIGLNGVILSQKQCFFASLPYGNFNDTARLSELTAVEEILSAAKNHHTRKLYPLEALIDDRHFRYAACYFTIGLLAESTEAFDATSTRSNLQTGSKNWLFSIHTLFSWWRKNRHREFLPRALSATDILAINGRSVAKMLRVCGDLAFVEQGFLAGKYDLSSFHRAAGFVLRSILFGVPGKLADHFSLSFDHPFEVEIQAEGEYARRKCRKITVIKCKEPVELLVKK